MYKNTLIVISVVLATTGCVPKGTPPSLQQAAKPARSTQDPTKYKACVPSTGVDPEKDLEGYWHSYAPDVEYLLALWESSNINFLKQRSADESCILMEQVVAAYYVYTLTKSREDLNRLIELYPEDVHATKWLEMDAASFKELCAGKKKACIPAPDHLIFEAALAGNKRSVDLCIIQYLGDSTNTTKRTRLGILIRKQGVLALESTVQHGLQVRLLDLLKTQIEEKLRGTDTDAKAAWLGKEITMYQGLKIENQSGMELKHDIIQLLRSYQ